MRYSCAMEKRDYARIDKLNQLHDLDMFWDDVRFLTRKITSDHSIKRWQCLAEIRYEELKDNHRKIKWAIFKNNVGLYAMEYFDTLDAAWFIKRGVRFYWHIKQEDLPIVVNNRGGHMSLVAEDGLIEIRECSQDEYPLTREEMYPKNSPDFQYGWISPEGDTYNTGYQGHMDAADVICEELGYDMYNGEKCLEDKGWIKVTKNINWRNEGEFDKSVFVKDLYVTKKQADVLFDLGLYQARYVKLMIKESENKW